MKRRLFIALNVTGEIRNYIAEIIEKIKYHFDEEVRFVPPENSHFTVVFLGYQDEEKLSVIETAMKDFAHESEKSLLDREIFFEELTYGPVHGLAKRMIWLTADPKTSVLLGEVKESLEKKLFEAGVRWQIDSRPIRPAHLTLARLKPRNIKDLPPILKKINWHFAFERIDLMESHLRPGGPIYKKIRSIALRP